MKKKIAVIVFVLCVGLSACSPRTESAGSLIVPGVSAAELGTPAVTPTGTSTAAAVPTVAPTAPAMPTGTPTAVAVPTVLPTGTPTVVVTPTVSVIVPDLSWLKVFAEVDTLADVDRAGLQEHKVRYEVVSGDLGSMALVATGPGKISRARIVADDTLIGIWHLSADRSVKPISLIGKFVAYHSPKAEAPTGTYIEFAVVKDWKFDIMLGAGPTDVLNQFVATKLDVLMEKGDMIVIQAQDDAGKKVNVGINAYVDWIPAGKK